MSTKKKDEPIKVLYVEDDLEFAELIKEQLILVGFEVAIATNSKQCKTLFNEFRPDILMVDLDLQKDIQGIDIIRAINTNYPLFPIIVYSSHVDSASVIETMKCGVMHHIGKDKSITELVVMLKNAIRQAYRYKENFQPEYQLSATTVYNIKNCILSLDGEEIPLKRIESRMFRQLCLHINEFVQPEELSMATWGIKKEDGQLHRYTSRLRQIIESKDSTIKIINKRGGYYQLECQYWKN